MSSITVKRTRTLSKICRGQSRRLVYSASVNHTPVLSTTPIAAPLIPEEIILQPILDIFDAPIGLGESSKFIRAKYSSALNSHAHVRSNLKAAELPSPSSSNPHSLRPPLPAPLPPAIIFDGPARPKNSALANQRRLLDRGFPPSSKPRRTAHHPTLSARPFSSSEPLVQLFDGPARITTYPRQSSGAKKARS